MSQVGASVFMKVGARDMVINVYICIGKVLIILYIPLPTLGSQLNDQVIL